MTRTRLALLAALLLSLALSATTARADSLDEIFAAANASYFRGDYRDAADHYRRLIDAGVVDPDVSYNLGASEARLGRHGHAIRWFERALWLRPGDDAAEQALDATRAELGRRRAQSLGEAEVDTGPAALDAVFDGGSVETWWALAWVFDLVLFALLSALLFARREAIRLALGIGSIFGVIGFAVFGLGLAVRAGWFDDGTRAVVLREGAEMREGPDPRASERHRALEGQRATILEIDREYARVRIAGVGEGWMANDDVGAIPP